MKASLLSSDEEEDSDAEESRKLREELADQATSVQFDKPARRQNRGFTVSIGKSSDDKPVRSEKRAQTLPSMGKRRGDHELNEESMEELEKMAQAYKGRLRRGSVVPEKVVPDEELEAFFENAVLYHQHGIMTEGQAHCDERERKSYGKFVGKFSPIVACQKGSKGHADTTPNQDNFSVTCYKNGFTFACAFDGHGPFGHIVSTRTVQTVPFFLGTSSSFEEGEMKKALVDAFELAQKDLLQHAMDNEWDVQASGSTAVSAAWKDNVIWTANAGDSRCVVGSEKTKAVVFETNDHKPDTPEEKTRIEASGGEVRTRTYPDGWVNHRIFVKGKDYPGLCMARTLGDECVKAHGVIATPEVQRNEVDLSGDIFFILASDGVWEFLTSEFVIKACTKKFSSDGVEKTLQKLQREARKRWKQEEGEYCDDITSIIVQMKP